jgi:putative membrane protein
MNDEPGHKQADAQPDRVTWLAFERTFLSHERTQMAWVRTSLALISFGFAIGKFFHYLHEPGPERLPLTGASSVGTLMIVIGLVALALANIQHVRAMKALRAQCPGLPPSLAWVIGSLLALLGILALVVVWLRD